MLHLIHPALVHFSVAFVIGGGTCEVGGLLAGRERLERFGSTLVLIGLASLVPTIASGYLAANTLAWTDEALALLGPHERVGWILFGLLLASQFWKAWFGGRLSRGQGRAYALILAAAVVVAIYGAWLGGSMVYGQGIGVR